LAIGARLRGLLRWRRCRVVRQRLRRLWRFAFGPVGEGAGGGGTGQLHGEVGQFRAEAQVARGAFGGFLRLAGRDGVQGRGSLLVSKNDTTARPWTLASGVVRILALLGKSC